jgi:hypothetical protein
MRCPDMHRRANSRIGIEGGNAQNAFVVPNACSNDMEGIAWKVR